MGSTKKQELLDQAIQALQAEERDDDDQLRLPRLLSELELLKVDGKYGGKDEVNSPAVGEAESKTEKGAQLEGCSNKVDAGELVKELRRVRRQNFVTHCLLSVMIVLTLGWQLSEVSLIMKVKDGLNHPFRSFGSMLSGMLKRPDKGAQETEDKETGPAPALKIPEMNLDFNGEKQ